MAAFEKTFIERPGMSKIKCRTPSSVAFVRNSRMTGTDGAIVNSKSSEASRSKIPRNQLTHDLRCPAIDALHTRICVKATNLVFPHKAVTTEQLDTLVDSASVHFACPELCH